MLKEILSISGKTGLYKLISKGKNIFIAESLIDGTRIPVYQRDKVVSLGDITMYTSDGDARLSQILQSIKQKENGEPVSFSPASAPPEELRTYFSQVLPDFDRDRIYPSDIKKVLNWYNLLVKSGLTQFEEEVKQVEEEDNENTEDKTEKQENEQENEIKEEEEQQ